MKMILNDWVSKKWLRPYRASKDEIDSLFIGVSELLRDGSLEGISARGRFTNAYMAALTLATIVLMASGYRSGKGHSHHCRKFEALPMILGESYLVDAVYLDNCRNKRNSVQYDGNYEVNQQEADELLAFVKDFEKKVRVWLIDRGLERDSP